MGFEVVVAGPPAEGCGADTRLERDGLRSLPLDPVGPQARARERWTHGRAVLAELRREKPLIVHMIGLNAALVGAPAARWAGVPGLVAEVTGLDRLNAASTIGDRFNHFGTLRLLGLSAATPRGRILVQTPEDAAVLEHQGSITPDRIILMPGTGVDPIAFPATPLPETHPPCVTVMARMVWREGIALAIQAQRMLLSDGAPFRLLLVGGVDADDPDAIPEQQLQDWEAQPGVFWLGPRTDAREILRETHVALLAPPNGSGVPRSLVQAAACGRPIVTTDIPGCRMIVRNWQTGLLVPPDDARALADALRIVVEDEDVRLRFGRAARTHFESAFTQDHAAALVTAVYRDIRLAARRQTSP